MTAKRILILQHISCEPAGAYEDELRARGLAVVTAEADAGNPLPNWRQFAAIVAMGGPMGAYEDTAHHWLRAEKLMLGEAAQAGQPIWGVCLGAQLLAASLGARVYPAERPEVGICDVLRTHEGKDDAVFSEAPGRFPTFQWHGDTFDLPVGATLLAYNSAYTQQAFVYRRAYGLQFHLEVEPRLANEWGTVPAYSDALERLKGPGALPTLVAELAKTADAMNSLGRRLFARWLESVVARAPVAAATETDSAPPLRKRS